MAVHCKKQIEVPLDQELPLQIYDKLCLYRDRIIVSSGFLIAAKPVVHATVSVKFTEALLFDNGSHPVHPVQFKKGEVALHIDITVMHYIRDPQTQKIIGVKDGQGYHHTKFPLDGQDYSFSQDVFSLEELINAKGSIKIVAYLKTVTTTRKSRNHVQDADDEKKEPMPYSVPPYRWRPSEEEVHEYFWTHRYKLYSQWGPASRTKAIKRALRERYEREYKEYHANASFGVDQPDSYRDIPLCSLSD